MSRESFDAVVVGARCAGAATALLLARAGMRVLVVDRGSYGADALSTHALMRGAVVQLHRWGVLDAIVAAATPPIVRTRFCYEDGDVDVEVRARGGIDGLFAPRRTLLDRVLVDAARSAGAEVRYGVRIDGVVRRGGRVVGVAGIDREGRRLEAACELVVGADGLRSRTASLVGAGTTRAATHQSAIAYGYFEGLPRDAYQWFFRPGAAAGVIPTNDGLANVFIGAEPSVMTRAGFEEVLARAAPELRGHVTRARLHGALRTFRGAPGVLRRAHGPGWALVGDAGFFRDPLTAHGIADALRDAELLARAAVRGRLGEYEALRDEAARGMLEVSDAIASFAWDAPGIRELHARLLTEMKVGLRAIAA